MKVDLLLQIAKRKLEMYAARDDQPCSGANRGVDVLPNAKCPRWRSDDLFRDQLRWCVSDLTAFEAALTHRKAEDEARTALRQF